MDLKDYIVLVMCISGMIAVYLAIVEWNKPYFELELNKNRAILKSFPEITVIFFSICALIKIYYEFQTGEISGLMFALLYTNLVMITVLCMTDYWEKTVPNRVLMLLILLCFLEIGICYIKNFKMVMELLPSAVLGFLFCFLSFGAAYIISKGNIGSGDVKLALVLGFFITGNYIVGTVFYGCILSAVYSVIQMIRKKVTRKTEIPFVPFLYLGLIITCFVR